MLKLSKKTIVLIILISIGLLTAYLLFDNLVFRLKSTDPALDEVATSSITITLKYSQPIRSIGTVYIDNLPVNDITISGKSVTVSLSTIELLQDSVHNIKIDSVTSKWFGKSINNANYTLKATYVDFSNLSEEQQKIQTNKSDSNQSNDPFLNNVFPIVADNYQIESTKTVDDREIYLDVTFFDEVPDYDNGGKVTQLSDDVAEKYRTDVIQKIKSLSGSPEDYIITYSNLHLNTKYSDQHHHD